ncbi:N/A [soil metagenome]
MSSSRPRVVIVQRYVTHYRVPLFERLREDLASRGVDLDLVHGFPLAGGDLAKQDTTTLPWAKTVRNRWVGVGSARLLWQPAIPHVGDAALVIVEQASSRLLNYRLFLRHLAGRTRLAFWGHGKNFKGDQASSLGELVKRVMSRRVHWWFAYNRLSAQVVAELGYPEDRITDVQNAVDTVALLRALRDLSTEDVVAVRRELDLPARHVAVYVGGMYPEKRLPFLLDAARLVREAVPDFALIMIGAGQDVGLVRAAAAAHTWIHYLGPLPGTEKVPYMAVADLMLMPGLVGLAILDSFALHTPIVTTADAPHSPEIDYLDDGRNGVMLPAGATPERYAQEVVGLLTDDEALGDLREGCRKSVARYTIEEMAARFAGGIVAALEAPLRR